MALILVGPADPTLRKRVVAQLQKRVTVHCADDRASFRKLVRAPAYDVVVLFQHDGAGKPNEPLLEVCTASAPDRPVIQILLGAHQRLVSGPDTVVVRYLLPVAPRDQDLAGLADFVVSLC